MIIIICHQNTIRHAELVSASELVLNEILSKGLLLPKGETSSG
jgi:hypothetical protein